MKRILITGAKSYIGTNVETYLYRYNAGLGREEYRMDTLDQREDLWENCDFTPYDVIFHVSGIAHADVGRVTDEVKDLYFHVNCDLACQTARKAREQGVSQFIYMSSVIVYGECSEIGGHKHITETTPCMPSNFYGESKLKAEEGLFQLENEGFKVAVLRPPFVYGENSKGNYPLLRRLAGKTKVFPDFHNERSLLYVENLAEFVRRLIDSGRGGLFFPQNAEYASTAQLVRLIGQAEGKKISLWKALNPGIKLMATLPGKSGKMIHKAFGSLTIDQGLSRRDFDGYQIYTLEESIQRSEGKGRFRYDDNNHYGNL